MSRPFFLPVRCVAVLQDSAAVVLAVEAGVQHQ